MAPKQPDAAWPDHLQIVGAHEDVPGSAVLPLYRFNELPCTGTVEFSVEMDMQVAGAVPVMDIECRIQATSPSLIRRLPSPAW